jgi:hypothetical protein
VADLKNILMTTPQTCMAFLALIFMVRRSLDLSMPPRTRHDVRDAVPLNGVWISVMSIRKYISWFRGKWLPWAVANTRAWPDSNHICITNRYLGRLCLHCVPNLITIVVAARGVCMCDETKQSVSDSAKIMPDQSNVGHNHLSRPWNRPQRFQIYTQ